MTKIAIIGANGMVGGTMLSLLVSEYRVSNSELYLFGKSSAGKKISAGGEEYTVRQVIKKIKGGSLAFPHAKKKAPRGKQIQGVTFSGGEPFLQAAALVMVAQAVKRMGLDITVYSGYTYEELCQSPDEAVQALLNLADYLIDGPYIHGKRDLNLPFRGSVNQRVINMKETRRRGKVVLYYRD